MMKHHVFLSYSHKDSDIMQRVQHDLETAGLTVWTDRGIEPGTRSWKRAIEQAIVDAGCLVCILSPDAKDAPWVRAELDHAELHDKPIFLILSRGDERSSVPFGFAATQWTDIRVDGQYEVEVARLIGTVQKRLNIPIDNKEKQAKDNENPRFVNKPNLIEETRHREMIEAQFEGFFDQFRPRKPHAQSTPGKAGERVLVPPEVSSILPPPFEWCEVPEGKVTLTEVGGYVSQPTTLSVERFWISKYPITVAQYETFLDSVDGYTDLINWNYSENAQIWREKHSDPLQKAFKGTHYPQTNTSWYEAVAFCQWLNKRIVNDIKPKSTGRTTLSGRVIRLPTEQEWQRAAQGNDQRKFPWGDKFDKTLTNTQELGLGHRLPVTAIPGGISPFGVADMSGNVWEWCLTEWQNNSRYLNVEGSRVLRGGSWENESDFARVTFRTSDSPHNKGGSTGFRVVFASRPIGWLRRDVSS
ncbi:MAG: SUMF1/EgtB/PvdO family nonheme iron enzyme [Anaerolineae bacterium]|nr:SUMF1/EgtB/PvdO family nonheme iron enzyme [Anaerolineae bacterium]